jgi:hypothetical protein
MRLLEQSECAAVAGGLPPGTVAQHNHRFYEPNRPLKDGFSRTLMDASLQFQSYFETDGGMTTTERELALGERFGPGNVSIYNGVGYANDGVTTLYDDDGDGAWDSGLQTGADGSIYYYGTSGWTLF